MWAAINASRCGNLQAPANVLKEWQANIKHLKLVPSLEHVGEMFRLVQYLTRPKDLRPGLETTIPRLNITQKQAADIAAFLSSTAQLQQPEPAALTSSQGDGKSEAIQTENPSPNDALIVARGRQLFQTRACGACHRFEEPARWEGIKPVTPAQRLAPDLRHARKRLRPGILKRWLTNPQALNPTTLMPNPELSTTEVEALAVYLTASPLPQRSSSEPSRLDSSRDPAAGELDCSGTTTVELSLSCIARALDFSVGLGHW